LIESKVECNRRWPIGIFGLWRHTDMKTPRRWLSAFLVAIAIAFLGPGTFAQDPSQLPSQVNGRSSLLEIMNSLDTTIFPVARIGVRTSSTPQIDSDSPVLSQDQRPSDSLFYSQGFKLVKVDHCNLTLRNNDTRLIAHSSLIADDTPQQRYVAELYVPLSRLSHKGKAPYRHTNNPDKSRLLGTWRTEFKSNRSRADVLLALFRPGHSEKPGVWEAETLTFIFDTKAMSEQFDQAFRQAIRLCRAK
jgi:hypothetical protein